MADFDASLQIEYGKWEEGKHEGDLIVGVYSYKGGAPKVGFNRYYENRKTGEVGVRAAGRLSWEDIQYLETIWEKIKETMEGVK